MTEIKFLIERGWITGNVRLEEGDNGIMCRIGEYRFWFDSERGEDYYDPAEYLDAVGIETALRLIEETLSAFELDPEYQTEYRYYKAYLSERFNEPAIVNAFMDYLRKYYDIEAFHQRTIENLLYAVQSYVHDPQQQKLMLQDVLDIGLSDAEWEGYFGETTY